MRPYIKHFLLFQFVLNSAVFAQYNTQLSHASLSAPEKRWAILHPFAALKVKKITKKALAVVTEIKNTRDLDTYENGGQLDAFRHAFTMALLAQKIPANKLRKLGKAHEKGNYLSFKKGQLEEGERSDSLACVMDLLNNELGLNCGSNAKKILPDSLKKLIVYKIKKGEAVYMKRDEKGNYTDCNGKEIILAEWKGKWFIPKCLMRNNIN